MAMMYISDKAVENQHDADDDHEHMGSGERIDEL
jgi:hypothetical protein